ncbi:sex hormone-binding globulin isoform X1 [Ochotona princeps]|uniref:sex hormone-binding globulin isoform X1 n=1 Tax=Ochotona princeps TaxID=9978 RepID=UPI002714C400|nr:sex hormone-binding globulin isoform X1 [Ochotona princeps]
MENRGPWAILRGLLLSLLLLLPPPPLPPTPHTHLPLVLGHILSNQVHKPAGSAEDPSAVRLSSSPGQEPLLVLTFDVTKLTKVSSSFELQTWDPEGVIFYGDANVEDDWFMLGLRAGRPEIQMHNPWAQLTVGAGPPLNDGRWHQVDLKIKGDSLLLDVDGEEVLRLSQISGSLHNKSQHIMRLAIGGLLFPLSILRLPLVPALDGCLRRSTWLDPQAQISASAHRSGRSCDTDLQPGTFFPPGTRAEFSLQDLPQPCAEPWAFSVVLELKPTRDSGHLLALGTPENPSWLSLRLRDQKVMLSSGLEPGLDLPLAWGLPLQLTLNLSSAVLSQGLEKKVLSLSPLGLEPMLNLWAQPQGRLFLGALPGEDSLASFCLAGLWAQGQKLDMDRALNRSYDLWSHSCPSSPGNGTDTSY